MKPPIQLKRFKKEVNNFYEMFGITNNILGTINLFISKEHSVLYSYKNKYYYFIKTR